MPTTTAIILAAGKWVLQRYGILDTGSTDTAVRLGQDGEVGPDCCVTLYLQARRCDTNALADVWFELNDEPPYGFFTSEGDHTVGPITFTVDGGGGTVYVVNGNNPISCNPGTIVTAITLTAPCDNCFNCEDGAPRSVFIGGMNGVSLYRNYRIYDGQWDGSNTTYTRWFEFILDRDVIPDNVCLCKISDCVWARREKNKFSCAYSVWQMAGFPRHIAEDVSKEKTFQCDIVYLLRKTNPTGVPTDVRWDLHIWIEIHEDEDGAGPFLIFPGVHATIGVFSGFVDTPNCSDAAGATNLYVDHGPIDDPPHFINGYSYVGTVINPNYILWDYDGCSRRPSFDAGLPLGFIPSPPCEDRFPDARFPYTWHGGWDGSASIGPDLMDWCPFEAKYGMTVSGTTKNCATTIGNLSGHSTLDGTLDGTLTPDFDNLGLPLLDTYTQYSDACVTITSDNLGDHMDVNLHNIATSITLGAEPYIIIYTIGPGTLLAWAGRGKVHGVGCGYPLQVVFTFDPTVADPSFDSTFYLYRDGTVTIDLDSSPLL